MYRPTMPGQRPTGPAPAPPTRPSVNSERRRARVPRAIAASAATMAMGIAAAASSRRRVWSRSVTTIAAGMLARAKTPTTIEAHARQFGSALVLLLDVWATNGGWRNRTADDPGHGDQRQKIRERLEERAVLRPGVHVLQLRRERAREPEQQRCAESPERTPVSEDERGECDESPPGGQVLREAADEPDREVGAAERGERAGRRDGEIARAVDGDSDRVRGARVLADRADPQTDGRSEDDDVGEDDEYEGQPDQQVHRSDGVLEEVSQRRRRDVLEEREVHVRDGRNVLRRATESVDVDVGITGDAEREEVERRPHDDLVGADVDAEERVHEGERGPRGHADEDPGLPASGLVRAPDAEEGAHQHHALEGDVDDTAPLGEEPSHGGERERRRVTEHRRDQRRPGHHELEMADGSAGGEDTAPDSEHADEHGAPARPPLAAADGPDASGNPEKADGDGQGDCPRRDRRQRQPEGESPEEHPCEPDLARARVPAVHAGVQRLRGCGHWLATASA